MADQIDPFYLVVDENVSVAGDPVGIINASLSGFFGGVDYKPLSSGIRLCLIGFSLDARVILPLRRAGAAVADARFRPVLPSSSHYGDAFVLLTLTIAADISRLGAVKGQVSPPTIFFITGNGPADDWQAAYLRLRNVHPQSEIIPFGYGKADSKTLQQIATMRAYVRSGPQKQDKALQAAVTVITDTMRHRQAPGSEGAVLVAPDPVEGFGSLPPLPLPGAPRTAAKRSSAGSTAPAASAPKPPPAPVRPAPAPATPAEPAFPRFPAIGRCPKAEPPPPLLLPDGWHKATEMALDGADTDALSVRAASLRGADHRDKGLSRQDAFGLYHLRQAGTEAVLGVVADGADDAPLSHIGAAEACRLLADEAQRRLPDLFAVPTAKDLAPVCEDLVAAVADRLVSLARSLRVDPSTLSTSLAAAIVETSGDPSQLRCLYLGGGGCKIHLGIETDKPHVVRSEFMDPKAAGAVLPMSAGFVGQAELQRSPLILSTSGLAKLMKDEKVGDGLAVWWGPGSVPSLQEFAWQLSFQHASPGAQADDRTAVVFWSRQPPRTARGGDQ
jgi:uncharacterized protein YegL